MLHIVSGETLLHRRRSSIQCSSYYLVNYRYLMVMKDYDNVQTLCRSCIQCTRAKIMEQFTELLNIGSKSRLF